MAADPSKVNRYTSNFRIPIYEYARTLWHECIASAFDIIDAALQSVKTFAEGAVAATPVGTSVTTLALGTGVKDLVTQAGIAITVDGFVLLVSESDPTKWMYAKVVSYSDTNLQVSVIKAEHVGGSGSASDWNISVCGIQGPAGADGAGVTPQAVGYTLSGGDTIKTLVVDEDATVSEILGSISAVQDEVASVGLSNFLESATSVELTSTRTFVTMTPARHGATVTLPDATAMAVGSVVHVVDNSQSDYYVRICNVDGDLLGFAPPRTRCDIGLTDNTTAAGAWCIANVAPVGIGSELSHSSIGPLNVYSTTVDMGNDIEIIVFARKSDNYLFAVAHNRVTRTFGTPALIRATAVVTYAHAIKHTSTQFLVVSCQTGTVYFEAVAVTVDTSTLALTPGTAAATTLASSFSSFNECYELLAVPADPNSFVVCYRRATTQGIRAISISGSTVTIGTEKNMSGNDYSAIAVSGSVVVTVSVNGGGGLYTLPFTVSGSTLTQGTGSSETVGSSLSIVKFFALGSRWVVITGDGNTNSTVLTIVSLSGTTTTSEITNLFSGNNTATAAVIGDDKLLCMSSYSGDCFVIVTDNAGTPVLGTKVGGFGTTGSVDRQPVRVNGNSVLVREGSTTPTQYFYLYWLDCSGTTPTIERSVLYGTQNDMCGAFNALPPSFDLRRAPGLLVGNDASYSVNTSASFSDRIFAIGDTGPLREVPYVHVLKGTHKPGINNRETWRSVVGTLQLLECAA